tara:strand:- start:159 stop:353 length:195 start_codon:yes stop_codon:yes gene_type:complete
MTNKTFIQDMNMKKGAFTKKAKNNNLTVNRFIAEVLENPTKYSSKTKKQANLAKTLKKLRKRKK